MKTLMAFSGGLDSTYLAFKILSATDNELHLFWMDLANVMHEVKGETVSFYGEQIEAERIAIPRILEWFEKNLRPVTFEVVTDIRNRKPPKEYPEGNGRGWRVLPMLRKAAEIVNQDGFDRFVYAKSPENIRSEGHQERDVYRQQWWTGHVDKATFETPLIEWWHGRPHAIQALPQDLRALTIGCNRASVRNGEPVSCGTCDKCALTKETEKLLTAGGDADVVLDYLLRLRKAGPYIDSVLPGDRKFGAGLPAPSPKVEN